VRTTSRRLFQSNRDHIEKLSARNAKNQFLKELQDKAYDSPEFIEREAEHGTRYNNDPTRHPIFKWAADRIYHPWDEALGRGNPQESLALYAEDATLKSPLVPYLTGKKEGVIRGREALVLFLKKVAERKPPLRQRHRTDYFSDGRKLMWEYP
jgi:hypothetical protein